MPHIKFGGDINLKPLWEKPLDFSLSVPEEDCHIKFTEAFLGSSGRSCLFRYVVVEGRLTQFVQVVLALGREGWVLKLDRSFPVLRSPGVKLLLGILGAWILGTGVAVERCTVEPFLRRGRFYLDHLEAGAVEEFTEARVPPDPLAP